MTSDDAISANRSEFRAGHTAKCFEEGCGSYFLN